MQKTQKGISNLSLYDILTKAHSLSSSQGRKIIDVIEALNNENKLIYASKLDLQKMENRMLKKIIYLFGIIQTIMFYIIKIIAF